MSILIQVKKLRRYHHTPQQQFMLLMVSPLMWNKVLCLDCWCLWLWEINIAIDSLPASIPVMKGKYGFKKTDPPVQ